LATAHVFIGHKAIFKNYFGCFAGAHAQFIFFFAGFQTLGASFNNKGSHTVAVEQFSGAHNGYYHIAGGSVGNPVFVSVQYPTSIYFFGGYFMRIASLPVLASVNAQAPIHSPLASLGNIFFLLFGAVVINVAGAKRVMRCGTERPIEPHTLAISETTVTYSK
jgi:hypothetical protein